MSVPPLINSLLCVFVFTTLARNLFADAMIRPGNCVEGLAGCLGLSDRDVKLNRLTYMREYEEFDTAYMTEGYRVIESKIIKEVDNDDLQANILWIKDQLISELKSKYATGYLGQLGLKPSLSRELPSQDRNLIINVLMRLSLLEDVEGGGPNLACSGETTIMLDENNQCALNPIERRKSKQPNEFNRLGNLIFDAALKRAKKCMRVYKARIINKSIQLIEDTEYQIIKNHFDRAILHRIKKTFNRDEDLDRMFIDHPRVALQYIKAMPFAIEPDEIDMVLDTIKEAEGDTLNVPLGGTRLIELKFEKYLDMPCSKYTNEVSGLVESLDFDMQLQQFLPADLVKSTDDDDEVNRQRAYVILCQKLLKEKDRFLEFYNAQQPETPADE